MNDSIRQLPNLRLSTTQLINALKDKPFGETFTFGELEELAGLDVREHRSVLEAAKKSLLKNQGKLLANLRGIGYRISKPGEMHVSAGSYRNKATKDLKRGRRIIDVVDMSGMSDKEKEETCKEGGKISWLISATKVASKEKLGQMINFVRPPSEQEIVRFLLTKSQSNGEK